MNRGSRWLLIIGLAFVLVGLIIPTQTFGAFTRAATAVTLPDGTLDVLRGTGTAQVAGRIDVTEAASGTFAPISVEGVSVVFTIQTAGVTFAAPSLSSNTVVLLGDGGSGTIQQRIDASVAGNPPTGLAGVGTPVVPSTTSSSTTRINNTSTAITVTIVAPSSLAPATVRLQNLRYLVAGSASPGPITIRVSGSATAPAAHGVTPQDVSNATVIDGGTSAAPPAKYLIVSNTSSPVAGSRVTITAQLADANNNPVPAAGRIVTWSSTNGGAFASATSVTNSSGAATVNFITSTTAGTVHTVTATDGDGLTGTSGSLTGGAGAAAKLAFTTQPGNGTAGSRLATQPVVRVQDQFGNTVPTATTSITLAIGTNPPGTGVLQATANPLAAAAGVASFAGVRIDQAGAGYTLSASAPGLAGATSTAFTIAAAPASKLAFSASPGGATKTIAFATQPVVAIQDAFGNATSSTATVSLAIKSGTGAAGAALLGSTGVAAAAGLAIFANLAIDKSGAAYQLTASAAGLTARDSAAFTVSGGVRLSFTTQPGTTDVGIPIPGPPTVTVQRDDGSRETTSSASITIAFGANPAGATLSGTTPRGATAGLAGFSDLRLDMLGTGYILTASSPGLTGATSAAFNVVTAATATQLVFTTQPGGATKAAAFTIQPVVEIQDANGGRAVTATDIVSVAIKSGTGAGGALLSGVTSLAAVAGVAAFPDLAIGKSGAGYQLTATAAGLNSADTTAFTVTGGTGLAFTTQPENATSGSLIPGPPRSPCSAMMGARRSPRMPPSAWPSRAGPGRPGQRSGAP